MRSSLLTRTLAVSVRPISVPRRPRRTAASRRVRGAEPTSPEPEALTEESSPSKPEVRSFALNEMLEEVRDSKSLGSRGEGWVVGVVLAWMLLLFPPVNLFGLIAATGWILSCAGVVLFCSGVLALGRSNFPLPFPRKNAAFVQDGIYAHVRHPQYGGMLLLCLGISAITRNETRAAFCLLLWFLLEKLLQFEERILAEHFEDYSPYRGQTKKLIPALY